MMRQSSLSLKHVVACRHCRGLQAVGVTKVFQPQRIVEKIVPSFQTLARDLSDHVRSALAGVVMKISPFLGREATIEHLLPLFLLVRVCAVWLMILLCGER